MDTLMMIEEQKRKLDDLIKINAPYARVLELSSELDELLVKYYKSVSYIGKDGTSA